MLELTTQRPGRPESTPRIASEEAVRASIAALNAALSADDASGGRFESFREARATTQRIRSRQVRFEHFVAALEGRFAA